MHIFEKKLFFYLIIAIILIPSLNFFPNKWLALQTKDLNKFKATRNFSGIFAPFTC